ncbi:M20/M25/M40 family metallo-hydrolase [Actinomadura gamaensis]|uniref:M20/M25/M40 family metallo-hydrolase n=1 Tax=Actinomadura gamaensis TaxID=1763541 RepID=A0ABV9TW07_9ACTN
MILAAAAALVTAVTTAPAGAVPAGAPAGGGPSPAACAHRVNDTARKLVECVRTEDLWRHMRAFQAIADAHPGADGHPSRNSGEPGYKASVDYVAKLMRQSGYDVTIQTYKFFYFAFTSTPTFREVSPTAHDYTVVTDWNPGQSTGSASAALQPAGGIVIPPTPTPSSTSGCTAADFTGFTAGRVALVQRGGCNYGVKVQNAQAAGASGVIVFNEGNPGRTDVVNGSLVDANGNRIVPTIPVVFTSFATGNDLYTQYQQAAKNGTAPPVMGIDIKAKVDPNADDYNVIAESKGGDPNHVVVVDAHLDAIYGAGMLDNASGSATILNIAQLMHKVTPRNKLRFIWFGGEELGELGSSYYVGNLAPADLAKIGYDLDADVTATPNYDVGVLDPAGVDLFTRTVSEQFPPQVYEPSKIARDLGVQYFDSIGKKHIFFSPVGTDAEQFNLAGVPASGVLTGQDCCKLQSDVDLFGGYTGNFEGKIPSTDGGCVDNPFRWCDNLSNNDPRVMTFMSRGFANMVGTMAFDTRVLSGPANPRVHAAAPPSSHSRGAPVR